MAWEKFSKKDQRIIKEMREQGKSYKEIAALINDSKDRVRYYCRSRNIQTKRIFQDQQSENARKNFIELFNEKFKFRFRYISGYKNCDSNIIIKCLRCDHSFEWNAQVIRKRGRVISCPNCRKLKRLQRIEAAKIAKRKEKEAAKAARALDREKQKAAKKKAAEKKKECLVCGETFFTSRENKKCCSDRCSRKRASRRKEFRKRKQMKELQQGDNISIELLIQRDRNVCHICGELCDQSDFTITKDNYFVVGRKYPSIDHVKAITKGGSHSWENVKLAHHYCNTVKSDRDYFGMDGEQMTFYF